MISISVGGSIITTQSITRSLFYLANIYLSGHICLHSHLLSQFFRLHNFAKPCSNAWIQLIQWNRGLIRWKSSWYIFRFMTSLQVNSQVHFPFLQSFPISRVHLCRRRSIRVHFSVARWLRAINNVHGSRRPPNSKVMTSHICQKSTPVWINVPTVRQIWNKAQRRNQTRKRE